MHKLVKAELDNLELQFPGKCQLDLDQYAELYNIGRRTASRHLRRRGIPATKEGRELYISTLDLAIYKARCKIGPNAPLLQEIDYKTEMRSRRGINQIADKRQLEGH